MKTVKILYTEGNGSFEEKDFELPNIQDNEIRVQAKMTGVCRSDIDTVSYTHLTLPTKA